MNKDFLENMADQMSDFLPGEEAREIDAAAFDIIKRMDGMSHLGSMLALKAAREMLNNSVSKSKLSSALTGSYLSSP